MYTNIYIYIYIPKCVALRLLAFADAHAMGASGKKQHSSKIVQDLIHTEQIIHVYIHRERLQNCNCVLQPESNPT